MTFIKVNEYRIKNNEMVTEYEHQKTGARHFHRSKEGIENAFQIVFQTPVNDRKGIPHILEHMVLEGSKKYPIPKLFYKLFGKNFETYLNAGTYPAYTGYHFAANLEEGFLNLQDIYLAAVLEPLIDEKTFLQEGFRYEKGENGELKFSGVVYNEMMAWVGQTNEMYYEILKTVYNEHPYNAYSGGEPFYIADVTYKDILDFHKKYYTPSNSTTFTVGSIDINKIHQKLNEFFNKFEKTERYKIEEVKPKGDFVVKKMSHCGTENILANLIIDIGNVSAKEEVSLENTLLLSTEKIQDYFIQRNKGLVLEYCYLDEEQERKFLVASFQVENEENIQDIWTEWCFAWQTVVEESIDKKIIDSHFKNVLSDFYEEDDEKYSVDLMNEMSASVMSNRAFFEKETEVFNLEQKSLFEDPNYLTKIINENLLNKKKSGIIYSIEDKNLVENYKNKILEKEKKVESLLSEDEKDYLTSKFEKLSEKENKTEHEAQLPSVKIENVFDEEKLFPVKKYKNDILNINGAKVFNHQFNDDVKTAEITMFMNIAAENEEEYGFEILQSKIIDYTCFKNMSKEETNIWKRDGLNYFYIEVDNIFINKDDSLKIQVIMKGNKDSLKIMADKALSLMYIQDFQIKDEVLKVLKAFSSEYENRILYDLRDLTKNVAQFKNPSLLIKYFNTITIPKLINALIEDLSENNGNGIYKRFVDYYQSEKRKGMKVDTLILQGDNGEILKEFEKSEKLGSAENILMKNIHKKIEFNFDINKDLGLIHDTSSAYTAVSVFNTPCFTDRKNYTELEVALQYLEDYIMNPIRIENGAYGASAKIQSGSLYLFAYRTPKPFESAEYFKSFIDNLLNEEIDMDRFENARKTIFAKFLKFLNNRKIALQETMYLINGEDKGSVTKEKMLQIINMKPESIKNTLSKYFNKDTEYTTVITTNENNFENTKLDLLKMNIPFE